MSLTIVSGEESFVLFVHVCSLLAHAFNVEVY